jgi:AraC-like DNA-binding protein
LWSGRWLWRRQAVHVGPELFARQRRLVAAIQSGRCETERAFEAILCLAADCLRAGSDETLSPRTARRDRELVESVRHVISADPSGRVPLAQLARGAGVGPVTLCTVFRRVTGSSIHAYRLDLRLKLALERLERAGDLSRIALDLGFDSHSHFSRHFRARFGASPSRLRDDLAGLGRLRLKERDSAPAPRR